MGQNIFIIGIVNFNHRFGCQKCLTEGVYSRKSHRMSFPRVGDGLRTNQNFRYPQDDNEAEVRHHKEYSILQELPIDMVLDFTTSDPLHLLELGIMKKYVCF